MKALILAAGLGTRLAPITDEIPKSLVPVNEEPILFKQLKNLQENGVTDITVVSGYKSEILIKKVNDNFPNVKIINNEDYNTTNNMYSAYLAKDELLGSEFLMMNADVYYDSSALEALINDKNPNAIITDIGNYNEESMKVVEKDGRVIEISKLIKEEDALGASIDVYKFSKEAAEVFFRKCSEYIEKNKELKMWSEVALNDILKEVEFSASPLVGRWMEIDNHEDLAMAEKIFSK